MSGEAKPSRVAWLLARAHDGSRAPRPQHKDFKNRDEAVAYKQSLQCRYGDAVAVSVSPTPAPQVKTRAQKPPAPIITEEESGSSQFWVSVFIPPRNGGQPVIQHHGFADRRRAEALKLELKSRGGDVAICLTTERPPGASPSKGGGR